MSSCCAQRRSDAIDCGAAAHDDDVDDLGRHNRGVRRLDARLGTSTQSAPRAKTGASDNTDLYCAVAVAAHIGRCAWLVVCVLSPRSVQTKTATFSIVDKGVCSRLANGTALYADRCGVCGGDNRCELTTTADGVLVGDVDVPLPALIGGIAGAVVLIGVGVIVLCCCVARRRRARESDGNGNGFGRAARGSTTINEIVMAPDAAAVTVKPAADDPDAVF